MKTNLRLMILAVVIFLFVIVIIRGVPRSSEKFTFSAEELSKALYLSGCWQLQVYSYPYEDDGKTFGEKEIFIVEDPGSKAVLMDTLRNITDPSITITTNLSDTLKPLSHMILLKYNQGPDVYGEYSAKSNKLLFAYPVLVPGAGPADPMYSKAIILQMSEEFKETITNLTTR